MVDVVVDLSAVNSQILALSYSFIWVYILLLQKCGSNMVLQRSFSICLQAMSYCGELVCLSTDIDRSDFIVPQN